ncbi:hypothetical protein PPTG_05520 [Phytophthora nicotianae INRA-310]|uniref:HAT C-terminal dimerisation domain-containing protein n=1 Tax=Phytophthora nicotianae (strain INRA-310) TaxID=761204 RepID=W2QXA0_PHYN3|nr:hypothetical protein PPTG_05520 [Phytophthora nicotianae INRA-310]ETN17832.1 hypothetical protein PPTG_05520 [Phytophthora nicotianae INRA-310]
MKKNWTTEQREEASMDTPLEWWTLDTSFPVLHNFAEKMLSIPTSSAASERLWSVHGFTHSKRRNRLKVSTVEKLSFIYINNGDSRPTRSPLYKTSPATPNVAFDSDIDSDRDPDNEDDDYCMFDLSEREFDYLLDAIVSVDISQ